MVFDSGNDVAFESSALGKLYARNKPGCLFVLFVVLAVVGLIVYRQLG